MQRQNKILVDIVNSARLIMEFTENMTFEMFTDDIKTQSATLHQMMIIGEASKQLADEFRDQHPAISWSQIGRMRDHLIHRYFNVKMPIIWDTIQQDIPPLCEYLLPMVTPFLQDEQPSEVHEAVSQESASQE